MVYRYTISRNPAEELRREVNQLISGFFGQRSRGGTPAAARPAVNVWETDDAVHVELETPGIKNDQTDISVTGNELTIEVRRPVVEEESVTFHRRERPAGSFVRVLRMPVDVDADRVEARLHQGVLNIRLPKTEAARPRKIQVQTTD
jgi:HSP20 family protein